MCICFLHGAWPSILLVIDLLFFFRSFLITKMETKKSREELDNLFYRSWLQWEMNFSKTKTRLQHSLLIMGSMTVETYLERVLSLWRFGNGGELRKKGRSLFGSLLFLPFSVDEGLLCFVWRKTLMVSLPELMMAYPSDSWLP